MMNLDNNYFACFKSFATGGSVWLMNGLDKKNSDYSDLITIACFFAKKGHTVRLLSSVHYKDPVYRCIFGELIGTRYYRKCPDLLIDGNFYEYESYKRPFSSSKISHMLKRGAEQAERIIIDNNKGASDRFIVNMIVKRSSDKHFLGSIEEVFVYEKGNLRRLYYKKAVGSFTSPRSTNP